MQQLGRYNLLGLLGEGGSAKVYEAELNGPAGFRKRVALKVVADELDQEHRNDLINEARLGALLRHPNVVDIYELGDVEDHLFVAMELVDGPTFLDLIRRYGPPPSDVALDLCRQMTRGLVHAHGLKVDGRSANLIHRDLKLSNILLDPAGLAKISDFGIARAETISHNQTASGFVRGSLGYMSPEQMTGSRLDQRTDLFSLGVVFYQLLTGSKLIRATSARDYFTQLLDIDEWIRVPEVMAPIRAAIPGMDALLFRMLRQRREQRIDTAVDVRKELNALRCNAQSKIGIQPWLDTIFEPRTISETGPKSNGPPWVDGVTRPDAFRITTPIDSLSSAHAPSKPMTPANISLPTDDFVGREEIMKPLLEHLGGDGRVVCLKGHGGVGKSRLALELIPTLGSEFVGGSWFCSLENLTRREDMLSALGEALKISTPKRDANSMEKAIATALSMRGPSLIIIDAAEGVPGQLQRAIERWMTKAPDVRWVITSRRLIKISGARVVEVKPMSVTDAVALYCNRSDAAIPGLAEQITGKKLRRLVDAAERIPYAIELIAAQAAERSPDDVLRDLERKKSDSKNEFIEATIGWSWRQLSPWERWTLTQLSVFRGGFFIEQAEEVVDLSAWPDAPWVVHVVGGLLEKSLLTTRATEVGPRFDLYRMVARLAESVLTGQNGPLRDNILLDSTGTREGGEARVLKKLEMDRDRVYARHAQLFGRLGHETYDEAMHRHGGLELWTRHRFERRNLEIAFDRSLESGRSQDACNLVIGLGHLLADTKSERKTLSRVDRLLAEAALSKSARTRLLYQRTVFLRRLGRLDLAGDLAQEVIQRAREIRSSSVLNQAKITRSGILRDQGNIESAMEICRSVLQVAIQHGKEPLEIRARNHLALCYMNSEQNEKAAREYERALERAFEIGDVFHQAMMQGNLALAYARIGRVEEARQQFHEAIAADLALKHEAGAAVALANLGHLEISLGNYDAAWRVLQEARDVHTSAGRIGHLCQDLLGLGIICMNTNRIEEAEEYLELACTMARQRRSYRDLVLFSFFAIQRSIFAGELERAEGRIREVLRHSRRLKWNQGEALCWSLSASMAIERKNYDLADEYVEEAAALLQEHHVDDHAQLEVYRGRLALYRGDPDGARRYWRSGHRLRKKLAMGEKSSIGLELSRLEEEISAKTSGPSKAPDERSGVLP